MDLGNNGVQMIIEGALRLSRVLDRPVESDLKFRKKILCVISPNPENSDIGSQPFGAGRSWSIRRGCKPDAVLLQ